MNKFCKAKFMMKRSAEHGFTLVEIMIVVAIIALLAAIAIPNVLRGRTSANEAAAVGNLRALVSSLEMFRSVNSTYPAVWATGPSAMYPAGQPAFGPGSFNLTLPATVQSYTYAFTALPAACAGTQAAPCDNYTITANPQTANVSGTRAFFADSSGSVRHCTSPGTATVTSSSVDTVPAAC